MTANAPSPSSSDSLGQVDWQGARALMKRVIAANVRRAGPDEIEDLVQDASVGLMRAVLRGSVENLEAMTVVIAKRAAINWMRRLQWTRPLGEDERDLSAPEPEREWLSADEAQFYVRQILHLLGDTCRELFELWLETLNLHEVAKRLGLRHAAVRQRRVRCNEQVRRVCLADEGPLGQWAREALGVEA